mgnify:CR=1 FL=1
MFEKFAEKLTAKILTPEKITDLALKMFLAYMEAGKDGEKVYRIQRAVTADTETKLEKPAEVVVWVFSKKTKECLTIEPLPSFLAKIFEGANIAKMMVKKIDSICTAMEGILIDEKKYFLIGAAEYETEKGAFETDIEVIEVKIEREAVNYEEKEKHAVVSSNRFTKVFPEWLGMAKEAGEIPELQ